MRWLLVVAVSAEDLRSARRGLEEAAWAQREPEADVAERRAVLANFAEHEAWPALARPWPRSRGRRATRARRLAPFGHSRFLEGASFDVMNQPTDVETDTVATDASTTTESCDTKEGDNSKYCECKAAPGSEAVAPPASEAATEATSADAAASLASDAAFLQERRVWALNGRRRPWRPWRPMALLEMAADETCQMSSEGACEGSCDAKCNPDKSGKACGSSGESTLEQTEKAVEEVAEELAADIKAITGVAVAARDVAGVLFIAFGGLVIGYFVYWT